MATSTFEAKIITSDDPSGVRDATLEAIKYTDALGKVAAQEEKMAANKSAKDQLKGMTEEQKKAASSAYLLAQEQAKANRALSDVGPAAGNASFKLTEFWSAVQIGQQAFQLMKGAYDGTVGAAQEYNLTIIDLAQKMGASTEEASKMVDIGGAVRITQEQITTSMTYAIRNGIEPNIEGLGKLADEYVALNGPVERGQFLLKNFGRSGMDMGRLLQLGSEGVNDLVAEMHDGLIVTEESAAATKRYFDQVDRLNDSWMATKITVGNEVIPTMANLLEAINNAGYSVGGYKTIVEYLKISQEQQTEAAVDAKVQADLLALGFDNAALSAAEAKAPVEDLGVAIDKIQSKDVWIRTYLQTIASGDEGASWDNPRSRGYNIPDLGALTQAQYNDVYNGGVNGPRTVKPNIPGRAAGGDVSAGHPYWIGEQGIPELFVPQSNGRVVPANKVGGNTIHIHINGLMTLGTQADLKRNLIPIIQEAQRAV